MKEKIKFIGAVGVIAIFVFGTGHPTTVPAAGTIGAPAFLRIPVLEIIAPITPVGLTPTGGMDSPDKPEETAWYAAGSRPGEKGSAVIGGHAGWKENTPAVFDRLDTLSIGDRVLVESATGSTTVFVVYKTKLFDWDADASEVFTSNDGKAYLNLITCTGEWNKEQQNFTKRLVVFAVRE